MAKFREIMEKNREEQEKQIGKVLLPHQMKRLQQIVFQQRTRGGIGRAAGNEEIAQQLGITDAQREKLKGMAPTYLSTFGDDVCDVFLHDVLDIPRYAGYFGVDLDDVKSPVKE